MASLGAVAERIGQRQPDRPGRVVGAHHLAEHRAERRVLQADDRAGEAAVANQTRSALPVGEVGRLRAQVGQRLVLRERDVRIAVLDLLTRLRDVGALGERTAYRRVHVRRPGHYRLALRRIEPDAPVVGALRIDDQRAKKVLRLQRRRARDDQVLPPLRDFGACRHQVERRRLPDVDARAVGALELQGQIERALLHVHRRERRHQRPVTGLGVGGDLRGALPSTWMSAMSRLRFSISTCARATSILKIAQQRLREDRLQRRGQRRREARERVVGGRPLRDEADVVAAAAPLQALPQAGVGGPVVGLDAGFAGEQVDRRRRRAVAVERAREGREEGRVGRRDAGVAGARLVAHDRQVGIVLHRHPHRFVARQAQGLGGGRRLLARQGGRDRLRTRRRRQDQQRESGGGGRRRRRAPHGASATASGSPPRRRASRRPASRPA